MSPRSQDILVFSATAVAWVVVPYVSAALLPDWQVRGQFGDLYGSTNALFSGLAFAGLLCTLWLQQRQLELQRSELKLQREELALQREEMAASRAELANQARAQMALFRATAAQIAVASMLARVEAIKIASSEVNAGGRTQHVKEIEAIAVALNALSDRIETQNVGVG